MLIGYARVSKGDEQTTAPQLTALQSAGVERTFEEAASGGRWDRPELHRMIDHLRKGDVVVVWKLDRPVALPQGSTRHPRSHRGGGGGLPLSH